MTPEPNGTQCVYTIVGLAVIETALKNNGKGEFTEGTRWVSAHKHLDSVADDGRYPLLLADAATTAGVQWAATIDDIVIAESHTRVTFANLVKLPQTIELPALRKASDGKPLSAAFIRPYVPCIIAGKVEDEVHHAIDGQTNEKLRAFNAVGTKSALDFANALSALQGNITARQRSMLVGHALAPGSTLSMRRLAELGGYADFYAANTQYGGMGRKFADFFGIAGLDNQTQALAYSDGVRDEHGHFAWTLRPPLVEAMRQLNWIASDASTDYERAAAAAEVDADPKTSGVNATDRQYLINARLGQGEYREKLLEIWDGKCALTGCALKKVLIASHAKAWADSSNEERLDGYNGLLLAAHVDKLFDAGLISFDDQGQLLVSKAVDDESLRSLGLKRKGQLSLVDPRHLPYLAAHRAKHGFKP